MPAQQGFIHVLIPPETSTHYIKGFKQITIIKTTIVIRIK